MDKIKILFLAADPSDAARLRLGQELRDIRERLQSAKHRDRFSLESRESVRVADITQAIFDVEPQIIQFSGHGMSTGELCFEDWQGKVRPVQPDALARLFKELADQIDCVVLNACYSNIQAKAISKHIPFVIGMNNSIEDKAAIVFSVGFYKALGANYPIEKAYNLGCSEIAMQGISGDLTPVLYTKYKKAVKWRFELEATLDELDEQKIKEVVSYLQQISGDVSLKLHKVKEGSVKFFLEGSQEGFEQIKLLIESGQFTEVLGIAVKSAELEEFPVISPVNVNDSSFKPEQQQKNSPVIKNRLLQLHKNLQMLYEQLGSIEDYLITVEPGQRARIQQQKNDLLIQIRSFEEEYQQCMRLEVRSLTVPQEEAEVIVAELVDFTENISNNRRQYSDEVINLLQEIRNTLNQPNKPAVGKLKVAIPLFFNILSYEVELDTESTLRRLFPTFSKLLKKT